MGLGSLVFLCWRSSSEWTESDAGAWGGGMLVRSLARASSCSDTGAR